MRHRSFFREEQHHPDFNAHTRFVYGLTRGDYLYIIGVEGKGEI